MMRFVLALRNLSHDKIALLLVTGGVTLAISLVEIQLGLYLGFERMTAAVIDHSYAQLWVVPRGTSSFDDPGSQLLFDATRAAATQGVKSVRPLVVGFAQWQTPAGDSRPSIIVGTNAASDRFLPWSMAGDIRGALDQPDGVAVDRTYMDDLGVKAAGNLAFIEDQRARVTGLTAGIRSFTTSPYVFTRIGRARGYLGLESAASTYLLIDLDDSATIADVQDRLATQLRSATVLTTAEFRDLNADHWLYSTGAGAALLSGAILATLIGGAIVAQTLYARTKDHALQFATLRALGAAQGYVVHVVLSQALVSGLLGYGIAVLAGISIAGATQATAMPVVMSWQLSAFLLALTLLVSGVSAIAAVIKVTRVDPMAVLSR